MPSIETNAQSFRTLIRTRTFCIGLTILLLWLGERGEESSAAVLAGWQILFLAALLSLLFAVLGKIKRVTGFLLPFVFLIDSVLVGAWVSVSGGAVSFYIPYFLVSLVSAILILTPRAALLVVAGIFAVFIGTFYLDYVGHIPSLFEAARINFVSDLVEKLPPQGREMLYRQQVLRWFFFFLLTASTCALLMRQVWTREERLRVKERALEQKRHLIQVGELTGRVAHGVNTPLGLISGNLEMLMAETRKKSKTYKTLVQIDQYVQRAIRTVRDILDYSRQTLSEIKPVSLPEVIRSVVSAVQPKLKKAQGQLVLDVEPKPAPGPGLSGRAVPGAFEPDRERRGLDPRGRFDHALRPFPLPFHALEARKTAGVKSGSW